MYTRSNRTIVGLKFGDLPFEGINFRLQQSHHCGIEIAGMNYATMLDSSNRTIVGLKCVLLRCCRLCPFRSNRTIVGLK